MNDYVIPGYRIPTADGRALTVRPCFHGEGVQLGILGKRGGLVEAVPISLESVLPTIAAIDTISEVAWEAWGRHV